MPRSAARTPLGGYSTGRSGGAGVGGDNRDSRRRLQVGFAVGAVSADAGPGHLLDGAVGPGVVRAAAWPAGPTNITSMFWFRLKTGSNRPWRSKAVTTSRYRSNTVSPESVTPVAFPGRTVQPGKSGA